METAALERLDNFPYRHRVAEVMTAPVVAVRPSDTVAAAAARMSECDISSVIVGDLENRDPSQTFGILTERDVLRTIVAGGGDALLNPVREEMSAPLHTVSADAYVFVAIGRMDRLGIRHLVVVDANGRPVGMISARTLLKTRAREALAIGDAVSVAKDGSELAAARGDLPLLAQHLLDEGVAARQVAEVISAVLCDVAARAAALAEAAMDGEGWGAAPARWAYLVLGSAGRGESLLSADQDNAIVHDGDAAADPWFAELGRRTSDLLDAAGIPYCKGGVMASRPDWRGRLEDWRVRLDGWVRKAEGEGLLNVDIFYDFAAVYGDRDVAGALRSHAMEAARSPKLLRMMASEIEGLSPPLGLFGGLRTEEGRLDLKRSGLFPIVAGARIMALRLGTGATATRLRLAAARDAGAVVAEDCDRILEAQDLFMHLVLRQQIADLAAGRRPSPRIEVTALDRVAKARLKRALRTAAHAGKTAADAISHGN